MSIAKISRYSFLSSGRRVPAFFTANEYYQQDEMPHKVPELLNVPTDIYGFAYSQ